MDKLIVAQNGILVFGFDERAELRISISRLNKNKVVAIIWLRH